MGQLRKTSVSTTDGLEVVNVDLNNDFKKTKVNLFTSLNHFVKSVCDNQIFRK